jgi:hypothetical protein
LSKSLYFLVVTDVASWLVLKLDYGSFYKEVPVNPMISPSFSSRLPQSRILFGADSKQGSVSSFAPQQKMMNAALPTMSLQGNAHQDQFLKFSGAVTHSAGVKASQIRSQDGLNFLDRLANNSNNSRTKVSRTFQAIGSGIGWGLGAAVVTALLALPVAGIAALVGFVPLMHWLWPLAGFLASAPLFVGSVVGGLRGLQVAMKK